MKKPIEFDANVRAGAKPDRYPVGWIPVPDDLYERIPTHYVDGLCESVERFHVTLSPACPERSSPEPDYKARWEELWNYANDPKQPISGVLNAHHLMLTNKMMEIEDQHTPQGDQTGVKKEGEL